MMTEILTHILFIAAFLSILLFLERNNIRDIPAELYFIFGGGGYIISTIVIIFLKTYQEIH